MYPTEVFFARIPVAIEVPFPMQSAVSEVLSGEYEAGYHGEGPTILDIGENVGSFSIWASLRWPGSTIHSYEPHPGTFAILRRNIAQLSNIQSYNVAVYPSQESQLAFFARYDGDGEAGLADCMARTFVDIPPSSTFAVDILHPSALPSADVVKLDVEGAEGEILRHMDLSRVSLVLLEYQDDANRAAIELLLAEQFALDQVDSFAWDDLLGDPAYRRELAGNHYGHMVFSNRRLDRLRKVGLLNRADTVQPATAALPTSKLLSRNA